MKNKQPNRNTTGTKTQSASLASLRTTELAEKFGTDAPLLGRFLRNKLKRSPSSIRVPYID